MIKPCIHEQGEYISPIFVTTKNYAGHKLILNLKNLNQYIDHIHFKMHGLKEIFKMVEKKCFVTSLDIKDVNYSALVDESSQKHVKFIWKEQLHQFCVLPNGLSPYPRWFSKLLKPPLTELRKLKHDISAYIDDIFFRDHTKENWFKNIIDSVPLLRSLGVYRSWRKSQFLQTQELDILGFTINSVNMTVSFKKEKKNLLAS